MLDVIPEKKTFSSHFFSGIKSENVRINILIIQR